MNVEEFQNAVDKQMVLFDEELRQLRGSRVTPEFLDDVKVEAYGTKNPIQNVATVSVVDARTLIIRPWDGEVLQELEKAIVTSDLGVAVQINEGSVRVILPQLTQERRVELVKLLKRKAESRRVVIRNLRREVMKSIDVFVDGGGSEDDASRKRGTVEDFAKKVNKKIDEVIEKKEVELMKV